MAFAAGASADDHLFSVRVVSHPDEIPLGVAHRLIDTRGYVEGWYQTQVISEAEYLGDHPLAVMSGSYPGYSAGGLFSTFAEVRNDTGTKLPVCTPYYYVDDVLVGSSPQLNPGWSERLEVPVCVPGPGVYQVRVVVEQLADTTTNIQGEALTLWTGRAESEPVTIRVTEPEGVDLEAFNAFGGDPLPMISTPPERWGEILRRFPASTYAAYVVWEFGAKGISGMSIDRLVSYVGAGSAPLGKTVPDESGSWRSYSGDSFISRRDRWFGLVLQHHPDASIADELRFTVALDQYLLGDRAGCAAGLEELAEHATPEVASKAKELVAALDAKGMLADPVPEGCD
jgi:hypothetical protein